MTQNERIELRNIALQQAITFGCMKPEDVVQTAQKFYEFLLTERPVDGQS